MSAENWLSLTDYASKYRISVSTLRRRIKSEQIAYRLDEGRYLILDVAIDEHGAKTMQTSSPQLFEILAAKSKEAVETMPATEKTQAGLDRLKASSQTLGEAQREEPILSSASKLLNELKRAYMSVLQEKEEQLIQLKEEVSDLKTLVRVLEDDNERMRRLYGQRELR